MKSILGVTGNRCGRGSGRCTCTQEDPSDFASVLSKRVAIMWGFFVKAKTVAVVTCWDSTKEFIVFYQFWFACLPLHASIKGVKPSCQGSKLGLVSCYGIAKLSNLNGIQTSGGRSCVSWELCVVFCSLQWGRCEETADSLRTCAMPHTDSCLLTGVNVGVSTVKHLGLYL